MRVTRASRFASTSYGVWSGINLRRWMSAANRVSSSVTNDHARVHFLHLNRILPRGHAIIYVPRESIAGRFGTVMRLRCTVWCMTSLKFLFRWARSGHEKNMWKDLHESSETIRFIARLLGRSFGRCVFGRHYCPLRYSYKCNIWKSFGFTEIKSKKDYNWSPPLLDHSLHSS